MHIVCIDVSKTAYVFYFHNIHIVFIDVSKTAYVFYLLFLLSCPFVISATITYVMVSSHMTRI